MKKILLFLLIIPRLIYGQNSPIDSLQIILNNTRSTIEKVDLNCKLSKLYQSSDIIKAKEYAQVAANLASCYHLKGGEAKALILLGYAHLVLGEFDQGLDCHFKSLDLALEARDTLAMVASYNSLGSLYHKVKDFKRSIEYLQKSGELARKINDTLGLSKVYNNLGNIYEERKQYQKAFTYFSKAANMQQLPGQERSLAISLHNIGHVHIYLPHPEQGLPYLFKSLELNQAIHNNLLRPGTLGSIAQIYGLMGKKELAMQYAHQSYDWALKTQSSKKINAAAKVLQQFYADQKSYKEAYKYLEIVSKHEDILDLEHQKLKAAEFTAEHERQLHALQNKKILAEKETQALKIRKQQITLAFSAALMFLLSSLLLVAYRSRQRYKTTSEQLSAANKRMNAQNKEIQQQQLILVTQSQTLQKQNALLESHNSFKNRIFSIISHDLRTPFSSIQGVLNLLNTRILSQEDLSELFSLLRKEMEHSMEMMQSLLLWSKSQLSGSKVVLRPVDINKLVEDNMQLVSSKSEEKGILMVNNVSEKYYVLADQERLNFVLRNLIHNAVKFTSSGGMVISQTEERDNLVTISVRDTGKGIPPKNLARLFKEDRFTTLGTSREKGTGLGLMLCKELIETLHGSIKVQSEEGQGSTFMVILPKSNAIEELSVDTNNFILN